MKGMAPLAAICAIRSKLGYEKALEGMCERLGFRKDGVFGILNTLEEVAVGLKSMEDFADRLKSLETMMKASKYNKDSRVTLSTFHSAKGLEFDRVYMIDLLEGVIPSHGDIEQKQQGHSEAMEEAVRLFYVGMTRAKTHLELITYGQRGSEKVSESRFVTSVRKIVNPSAEPSKFGVGLTKKVRSAPIYNPNAVKSVNQLEIGSVVNHRTFGRGEIVAITSSNIEIKVEGTIKILSTEVCLANGLLEML